MTDSSSTTERITDIIGAHHPSLDASEKAAANILAEFVVIPRTDLPDVVDMDAFLAVSGENMIKDFPGERNRELGLAHLAVAEYKAARKQAENEAKRDARRDELAREITAHAGQRYADLTCFTQRAIDRIIELEEAAA